MPPPGSGRLARTLPRAADVSFGCLIEDEGGTREERRRKRTGTAGLRLGIGLLRLLLGAAIAGSACSAVEADADELAAEKRRVVRFEDLPELEEKEGPHPRNVWIYGRFTARTRVSGGVFLASVNEGVNWPDWEENFSIAQNPGDFVFRRVVFRAKMPLQKIRRGTKFTIGKTHPARLTEVVRVDGVIARAVLEDIPIFESDETDGRPAQPSSAERQNDAAGDYPPQRIVPFRELGAIAKREGVHPVNLWTWGKFSARSDLREGIVTATPAGLETRRQLELLFSGLATFYLPYVPLSAGEPIHRIVFHAYQPRMIRSGQVIEITRENPARVRRLFTAGGVLVWLDIDPPAPVAIPVELGSSGVEPTAPRSERVQQPAGERLATEFR